MKLAAQVKLSVITAIGVIGLVILERDDHPLGTLYPHSRTSPKGYTYGYAKRYATPYAKRYPLALASHRPLGRDRKSNSESTIVESSIKYRVASETEIDRDVEALVDLGARETGTPTNEKALSYLRSEYQKSGYETEIQTFTYSKFEDRGSNLAIDDNIVSGRALNGSPPGSPSAAIAIVPNLGRKEDFQQVDVKGKIAVVRRGEIRFGDKAELAEAAGAVGLVIVNNEPDNFIGTLDREIEIPVLSISGEQGKALLQNADNSQPAILKVDTVRRQVTGRNLIARQADSTQPKAIIGGHYDSVAGSPGANDNASGTVVVLEIARRLAGTPQAERIWFIAFDGEEDGLHGSRAFVDRATSQFLSQLSAMINFDMVGVNRELKVGGTASLATLAKKDDSLSQIGAIGGSDHLPFANAKVPVLFFTRGLDPNYHTPEDLEVNSQLLDETVEVGLEVTKQILE